MARVTKVFTFSNVVAVIALFIALGGSVYAAGKISGTQIKVGSVPGNRVKPKSLTARQVKPKSLTGKQIKADSLGAKQINESTLTGITASAIGLIHYVTVTVPISPFVPAGTRSTAVCPAGTYVIGGGASVNDAIFATVNGSAPNETHTGWTAIAHGTLGTTMTVSSICTAARSVGNSSLSSGGPRYSAGN